MLFAMTAFRLITLPTHGALEMASGMFLMAAPFVLSFSPAGTVAAVVIGAMVVGVALSSIDVGDRGLPISAHFALDYGLVVGLTGVALVLAAVAADAQAAAVFGVVALAQLALNLVTRYSARG